MKYFKKELWAASNSDDGNERKQAEAEWYRKFSEYEKQLEQIRLRLSASASKFFGKVSLHDGTLLSLSVGDALDSTEEIPIRRRKTQMRIIVTSIDNPGTYTLQYSGIRQAVVDFPSATPLFYDLGDSFGDWGYDELTDAGDGFFRHEVLFASGATIAIEFKHFKHKRIPKKKNSV
jgi:hypothetical protein